MANFIYKTRKNASPQGKPKVYFACRPCDRHLFDPIADEILSYVDAAIYIAPNEDFNHEEHLQSLEKMNLFILPITSNLLQEDCYVTEVEVPYAIMNGIPILPLMQEEGLDRLFNEKCGDLQYLDKNARDRTAISYEEKLRGFLTATLVGDELAKKVRDAFDAYIFLSYRKKDRKYAKELMQLIHENDFCRDVAIWYDEFLTPGENFNDMIATALDKSAAFALAVTPNLVNEENYVMTVEYPNAHTAKKPIIPVELVKTDHEALEKAYEDIGEVIASDDSKRLSQALTDALDKTPLRHRDGDAEHSYLIGLAYLAGIDVEKNHDRALSLITSAAECELPEAMEKLVAMYQNGEGVKRDYEKAIFWQEKLVAFYQKLYDTTQTPQNAFRYLEAIQALAACHTVLGNFGGVSDVYTRMIREAERISKELPAYAEWLTAYIALGYGNLGGAAELLGKLEFALECHQNALIYAEKQMKINPMATPLFALCHEKIGHVLQEMGKADEALEWYQKSIAMQEMKFTAETPQEHLKNLAQTYNNLGDLFVKKGNHAAASECYYKAFEIRREFAGIYGTKEDKIAFTVDCNDLAQMAEKEGALDVAIDYYLKSLAILEDAIDETDSLANLSHLSATYSYIGDVFMRLSKQEEAEHYLQKAHALIHKLANGSDATEPRFNLAVSYQKLGNIAQAQGDLDRALAYYQKALAIAEALAEQHDTPDLLTTLSAYYGDIGTILEKQGDKEGTFAYSLKALAIAEAVFTRTQTADAAHALSVAYYNVADSARLMGDLQTATEIYQKNLALCEAIAEQMPTLDAFDDLAYAHLGFAEVYKAANDPEEAVMHAEEAYAIWQTLAKQLPEAEEFKKNLTGVRALLDSLS